MLRRKRRIMTFFGVVCSVCYVCSIQYVILCKIYDQLTFNGVVSFLYILDDCM